MNRVPRRTADYRRHRVRRPLAPIVFLLLAGRLAAADAETTFALHVLPPLKARCFPCHGDDRTKLRGGLDLTSRAALLKGGDSGAPAVVAGKAVESRLYRAVLRTDADVPAMPPKENDRLTEAETRAFREWIDGG